MCPEIFNEEMSIEPLIYISESSDKITVMIDLPCVEKKDIDLKVNENSIEINAIVKSIRQHNYKYKKKKTVKFTFFHKTISLLTKISPENVKAKFEKSVLLITMPKKKSARLLTIE